MSLLPFPMLLEFDHCPRSFMLSHCVCQDLTRTGAEPIHRRWLLLYTNTTLPRWSPTPEEGALQWTPTRTFDLDKWAYLPHSFSISILRFRGTWFLKAVSIADYIVWRVANVVCNTEQAL